MNFCFTYGDEHVNFQGWHLGSAAAEFILQGVIDLHAMAGFDKVLGNFLTTDSFL